MLGNLNTSMSKEQKIENDKAGILKKCVGFFFSPSPPPPPPSLSNSAWLYQELIFPAFISRLSWQEKESIRGKQSQMGFHKFPPLVFLSPTSFFSAGAIGDESSPEQTCRCYFSSVDVFGALLSTQRDSSLIIEVYSERNVIQQKALCTFWNFSEAGHLA